MYHDNHNDKGDFLSQFYLGSSLITFIRLGLAISFLLSGIFLLLITIQVKLLAYGQVGTPLLAGMQFGPLRTCSGEAVLVSWGREAPRSLAW